MKRYLLFIGDIYYPRGGWDDFCDQSDSLEELQDHPKTHKGDYGYSWAHIIDTITNRMYLYDFKDKIWDQRL